jgi:hypothetical protein
LTPYYGSTNLKFAAAQQTLKLQYKKTMLTFERNHTKTSGLDPLAIRPAQSAVPATIFPDPQMPIASTALPHLTIDAEGLVSNSDGT